MALRSLKGGAEGTFDQLGCRPYGEFPALEGLTPEEEPVYVWSLSAV